MKNVMVLMPFHLFKQDSNFSQLRVCFVRFVSLCGFFHLYICYEDCFLSNIFTSFEQVPSVILIRKAFDFKKYILLFVNYLFLLLSLSTI